jgi:hypothetical protein
MGTAKAGLIPSSHSIGPSQSVKRPSELAFEKPCAPGDFTGRLAHLLYKNHLFEPKVSIGTRLTRFSSQAPKKGYSTFFLREVCNQS